MKPYLVFFWKHPSLERPILGYYPALAQFVVDFVNVGEIPPNVFFVALCFVGFLVCDGYDKVFR